MPDVVYANDPETIIRKRKSLAKSAEKTRVLMGTWLRVISEEEEWFQVETRTGKKRGFVQRTSVREKAALKVFFVDVGQGDGAIIESPEGILLIDGGPSKSYYKYLKNRAKPVIDDGGGPVHIDAMVVSHPDDDHFNGLTHLLRDRNFTFGRIYHNGIIRYADGTGHGDLNLGRMGAKTINGEKVPVLKESFSTISQVRKLINAGDLKTRFHQFWQAAVDAEDAGHLLHGARRLTHRDATLPGFSGDPQDGLRVEVLGPVVTRDSGAVNYRAFPSPENPDGEPSDSHTINGHSVVLKLHFGKHTFLFAGDLNIPAERHLIAHYQNKNPFRVDVAKACHHGSSDFLLNFLKKVSPHATVFSSGEDRLHDHPLPDALGAAVRHSRGDFPLLFSTELARTPLGGGRVLYGHINARSNGSVISLAQRKERGGKDEWHSFGLPFRGRFPHS
ncbi:MAG: MBL fold metallo-hydrolase [Pseudomonadales bacterium]